MVGILVSFWEGLFSDSMLVSGRVDLGRVKGVVFFKFLDKHVASPGSSKGCVLGSWLHSTPLV